MVLCWCGLDRAKSQQCPAWPRPAALTYMLRLRYVLVLRLRVEFRCSTWYTMSARALCHNICSTCRQLLSRHHCWMGMQAISCLSATYRCNEMQCMHGACMLLQNCQQHQKAKAVPRLEVSTTRQSTRHDSLQTEINICVPHEGC